MKRSGAIACVLPLLRTFGKVLPATTRSSERASVDAAGELAQHLAVELGRLALGVEEEVVLGSFHACQLRTRGMPGM